MGAAVVIEELILAPLKQYGFYLIKGDKLPDREIIWGIVGRQADQSFSDDQLVKDLSLIRSLSSN